MIRFEFSTEQVFRIRIVNVRTKRPVIHSPLPWPPPRDPFFNLLWDRVNAPRMCEGCRGPCGNVACPLHPVVT